MKAIFNLNLTKQWFDEIKSGRKTEEYRDIKPHWDRIFSTGKIKIKGKYYDPKDVVIRFMNGMAKNAPVFMIECFGLEIKTGKKEWGATPGKQYYTLLLGKIVNQL